MDGEKVEGTTQKAADVVAIMALKALSTREGFLKLFDKDTGEEIAEVPIALWDRFTKEFERKVIRDVSDKIYAMEWLGSDDKRDYWRNAIAWNVRCMAQDVDQPQASC